MNINPLTTPTSNTTININQGQLTAEDLKFIALVRKIKWGKIKEIEIKDGKVFEARGIEEHIRFS